jgi:hypothetical protein
MKKSIVLLIIGLIVIVGGAYLLMMPSNDYEVVIVDQVSELEQQLAALEGQVSAGTLTPEQATAAQTAIKAKLAEINAGMSSAGQGKLTEAQKTQLRLGLERLQQTLINFQSTLVAIDTTAAKDENAAQGAGATLTSYIIDIIDSVEDVVETVVDDYQADANVTTEIEQIDFATPDTVIELVPEEPLDAMASSTDDSATSTEASADEEMTEPAPATATNETVVEEN